MSTTSRRIIILLIGFSSLLTFCRPQEGISGMNIDNSKAHATGNYGRRIRLKACVYFSDGIKYLDLSFIPITGKKCVFVKDYSSYAEGEEVYHLDEIVAIPSELPAGIYNVILKSTSNVGKVDESRAKVHIKMKSCLPFASELDIDINQNKNNLHLESKLCVPKKIKTVKIVIKLRSLYKEYKFDQHSIVGTTHSTFHEHLDISGLKTGEYDVLLIVYDMEGRSFETRGKFKK